MALDKASEDATLIDCTHGHNLRVVKFADMVRRLISCGLIAGNIATSEAVEDYIYIADGLRVGLGSGSICITKVVTGVRAPKASVAHFTSLEAVKKGIPVIADGELTSSGNIVKALALEASSVMLGYLIADTDETPGRIIDEAAIGLKGLFKPYRGMTSKTVIGKTDKYGCRFTHATEGIEALIEYRESLRDVMVEIADGVKQGLGYVGVRNIDKLRLKAKFMIVAPTGRSDARKLMKISVEAWRKIVEEHSDG